LATNAARHNSKGGGGIKNGQLLELAEGAFDLFITSDDNLRYQQNLAGRRIATSEMFGVTIKYMPIRRDDALTQLP
jgi:hypothetical protein